MLRLFWFILFIEHVDDTFCYLGLVIVCIRTLVDVDVDAVVYRFLR